MAAPTASATIMIASSVMVPTSLRAGDRGSVLQDTAATPGADTQGGEIECVGGKADGRSLTKERRLTARRRATRRETVQEVTCVPEETLSTAISPHHHQIENATPRQALNLSGLNHVRIVTYPTSPFTLVKISSSLRNFNLFYRSHKPCQRKASHQRDSPHPRSPVV
jgi:hypothetical protein